jgi:hypothetical protein
MARSTGWTEAHGFVTGCDRHEVADTEANACHPPAG